MKRFLSRLALVLIAMVAALAPVSAFAGPCSSSNITITRVATPTLRVDTGITPQLTNSYVAYTIENATGATMNDLLGKLENFTGSAVSLATNENGIVHIGSIATGADLHFRPGFLT